MISSMAGAAIATISPQLHPSIAFSPRHTTLLHSTLLPSSIPSHHNKFIHHIREGFLICHAKVPMPLQIKTMRIKDIVNYFLFANLIGLFSLIFQSSGESEDLNEVGFGPNEIMEDYESDDEAEDNTESSIDLLLRLLHSMFKKVSKRARKASLSILPDVFSPQLVKFSIIK